MSNILGIDLGSTMVRAAVFTEGSPRLLASLPAVVAFPKKGDPITGEAARRQVYINPSRSCTAILETIADTRRRAIDDRFYNGVEIAGILLRELRATAQAAMGQEFRRCVLSVPDAFGWEERRALREAAALAGFHVDGFLVESCAAALGSGMLPEDCGRILVCDAGGSRFKASVLEANSGQVKRLHCTSAFDSGGRHFDSCIAAWLLQRFREEHGEDLSQDANAMQRIMEAAELAKHRLSENSVTTVSVPYITAEKGESLHLDYSLSRSLFHELAARLFREIRLTVEKALEEGGPVQRTLLCGGGAPMPALREIVGRAALLPERSEAACAMGAALAARHNYTSD